MSPESIRLFVAFDVPPEHRLWLQGNVVAPLRDIEGARWTDPEGQHVTLKFLGSVAAGRLDDISAACRTAAGSSVSTTLRIGHPGAFPTLKRARVLWAGIEDGTGVAATLVAELDKSLRPLGFEPETRGFTPHLTLARFKVPVSLEHRLPGGDPSVLPAFPLTEIVLYRSHLSPRGARYGSVARFPLSLG